MLWLWKMVIPIRHPRGVYALTFRYISEKQMMTNTQAATSVLARVGTFTGMPKANIQLANNHKLVANHSSHLKEIWAESYSKECRNFYCKYW